MEQTIVVIAVGAIFVGGLLSLAGFGTLFDRRPYRRPYPGAGGIILLALVMCSFGTVLLMAFPGANEVRQMRAVGALEGRDPMTAAQLGASQKSTAQEVSGARTLAEANGENARAELARAQARKTDAETAVIDQDRRAKLWGYGGVALGELLPILLGFGLCGVIVLPLLGAVWGYNRATPRR